MAHDDASLERQIPDLPSAQGEKVTNRDRMGTDGTREAIAFLADPIKRGAYHA